MLDRPAQREFGRIVRERLDYDRQEELPSALETLLQALKDDADDRAEPQRN